MSRPQVGPLRLRRQSDRRADGAPWVSGVDWLLAQRNPLLIKEHGLARDALHQFKRNSAFPVTIKIDGAHDSL